LWGSQSWLPPAFSRRKVAFSKLAPSSLQVTSYLITLAA